MESQHTFRRARTGGTAIAAVALLALLGCTAPGDNGGDPDTGSAVDPYAPEVDEIIGQQYRLTSAAQFISAEKSGIAAEYGLTLSQEWIESSPAALTALVGGQGQVATVSGWSIVNAVNEGIDVRIVGEAVIAIEGLTTVESLPDSGIESIEDLVGKTVGVVGINSGHDYRISYAMQQAGLDPDSVTFVAVPMGDMAANLQQGTIDAATVLGAAQLGLRTNLDTQMVADLSGGIFDTWPEIQWVMMGDFVDANPNAVAAFQCAVVVKGQELVNTDDELYDSILKDDLGFDDAAIEADVKQQYLGQNDAESLQRIPDIMFDLGKIPAEFDITDVLVPLPDNC
jgi:NitT/TauT family transport system substrate-binding protein